MSNSASLSSIEPSLELSVSLVAEAHLPTEVGDFRILGICSKVDNQEFVVLVKGELKANEPTLVRIHSQCLTGDVFHSIKCDCGRQLQAAMKQVASAGLGVIIYHPQEGRGIGIINKIRAYALQDQGADTVEANLRLGFDVDERQYDQCSDIIKLLGITHVKLMSNNPDKLSALQQSGITAERVPLEIELTTTSPALDYLKTKKEKMGHLLSEV
jgi:GTP cyclohydrolase II